MSEQPPRDTGKERDAFCGLVEVLNRRPAKTVDINILRNWDYRVGIIGGDNPAVSVGSLQRRDGGEIVVPVCEYRVSESGIDARDEPGARSLLPPDYRTTTELFPAICWCTAYVAERVV